MRLFRVEQTGYGTQSFRTFGNGNGLPDGQFLVDSGNYLQTIDMIVDFAGKSLRFPSGSVPGEAGSPRVAPIRSATIEKLLKEHD
jgi:hypothetical protein